jgi:hypothetical protein
MCSVGWSDAADEVREEEAEEVEEPEDVGVDFDDLGFSYAFCKDWW